MAETLNIGEAESSDDSSVSLTSTIVSDGDGKEYEVEGILAEKIEKGVIKYLTKWDGYHVLDSTWQDLGTFGPAIPGGQDAFKEWQERKMRISRGYEEAFDWQDLERKQDILREKQTKRRARRTTIKAKLNESVDALDSDTSEEPIINIKEHQRKTNSRSPSDSKSEENQAKPRKIPGAVPQRNLWTDTEKQVFLKALQESKGPYWSEIEAQYGRRGIISDVLNNKTLEDMQMQLQRLKQEFADAGRAPPDYLIGSIPRERPKKSKARSSKERRISSANSDSSNERTSIDSMMEEIRATEKVVSRSSPTAEAQKDKTSYMHGSSNMKRATTHTNKVDKESSDSGKNGLPSVPWPIVPNKKTSDSAASLAQQISTSTKEDLLVGRSNSEPKVQPIISAGIPKKPYSGTARTQQSQVVDRVPTGTSKKGPGRFSVTHSKITKRGPLSRAKTSGVDVTANWKGEPKIRKARTLPTTNVNISDTSQPLKTFKTLGARNSVQKWRRNEPAPDPARLKLVSLRSGELPKSPPTNAETIPLTELSLERSLSEPVVERDAFQSDPKEDTLILDDDREQKSPDHMEDDTSANHQNTADLVNVISDSKAPSSLPGYSISPINAPIGPRAYVTQALNSPTSTVNVSANRQTRLPADLGPLALRPDPTEQEKIDLFNSIMTSQMIFVIGHCIIGHHNVGRVKLAGFDKATQKLLLTIKDPRDRERVHFQFDHICTLAEYGRYWQSDLLGSGYVGPYPKVQVNCDYVAEFLAYHMSVGIFMAEKYTMVIWPAHSLIWEFLNQGLPQVPAGTVLRFAIHKPISPYLGEQIESPVIAQLRLQDDKKYREIQSAIDATPIQPVEKPINVVFREVFSIEFDRLIASNNTRERPLKKNFFLCFNPANCDQYEPDDTKRQALRWRASEEHDFFVQFLKTNEADMIYSMQDIGSYEAVSNGSWRHFIENVRSGVLIIHESCGRPDQLPHLAKFLASREGAINVWMISLSPMNQGEGYHPHLIRWFPHGGVILLTVSLMMYHPDEALRILRWFRLVHLPSKHRDTWKIAVRPRIREWLLDIHDLCHEETWQSPFGFHLQIYADIMTEILFLLDREREPWGLMVESWDTEVPLPEAPVVAEIWLPRGRKEWVGDSYETAKLDHEAIRWNDEELIQWFSEWAGAHIQDYRKFQVVLGHVKGSDKGEYLKKCYEKGYGYLEEGPHKDGRQELGLFKRPDGTTIHSAWERNFLEMFFYDSYMTRQRIPDQATLEKKDSDRREKENSQLPRLQEETEAARQDERKVAQRALATMMQVCRDQGGTEEEAREVGRRHLMWRRDEQGTASDKEVENCAIDMDWKQRTSYGWMRAIIAGTLEEREAASLEQRRHEKRLADKETLSGKEQQRMWDDEIEMWARRDREKYIIDHPPKKPKAEIEAEKCQRFRAPISLRRESLDSKYQIAPFTPSSSVFTAGNDRASRLVDATARKTKTRKSTARRKRQRINEERAAAGRLT